MIVWAIGGLVAGWLLATRLGVGSLGVFLLSSIALPLAVFVVMHRFDLDAVLGYAAFWVAVQGSYLCANVVAERAERVAPTPDRRGGGDGSLESA